MIRKRIMVIGPSDSGKSTLVRAINRDDGPLRKCQEIIFGHETMDVPAAYLENPWMYKHIISAAQNHASHILILVDQNDPKEIYSPGFARVFRCPVTGVIMKHDLKPENEQRCEKQLKSIGVKKPYFRISLNDQEGILALKDHLLEK